MRSADHSAENTGDPLNDRHNKRSLLWATAKRHGSAAACENRVAHAQSERFRTVVATERQAFDLRDPMAAQVRIRLCSYDGLTADFGGKVDIAGMKFDVCSLHRQTFLNSNLLIGALS
ncbi:MAG: hypothetical protein Fues2KO_13990 [Fuerstiella sp.]